LNVYMQSDPGETRLHTCRSLLYVTLHGGKDCWEHAFAPGWLAGWLPGLPHMLPADSIAVVVLDITQHRRLTEIVECTTCRPISQYIPLISPYLTPPPPSRSPSLPPLSTSTQRGPSLISKPAASSVPSRTSSLQQGHNSHPSHGLRLSAVARTLPPRWTTATTTKQHTADRSAAHY
jgi:hypothetical protein